MRASANTLGWYLSTKWRYLSTTSPIWQRRECLLQKAMCDAASFLESGFPVCIPRHSGLQELPSQSKCPWVEARTASGSPASSGTGSSPTAVARKLQLRRLGGVAAYLVRLLCRGLLFPLSITPCNRQFGSVRSCCFRKPVVHIPSPNLHSLHSFAIPP